MLCEFPPFPVIDVRGTGSNICRLRIERGLTVRDVQRYFGFASVQSVYAWEKGRNLPTLENAYALSVLLGVTIEEILVVHAGS